MTNRFLFKVNGELHCPDQICHPKSGSDWEGKDVLIPATGPLRYSADGAKATLDVMPDDEVWIWTHEDANYGRGWGLTARARVAATSIVDEFIAVTLKDVNLLPRPFGFKDLGTPPAVSGLLQSIYNYRHHQAYSLEGSDYETLLSLVNTHGQALPDSIRHQGESEWAHNIRIHTAEILAEFTDRRLTSQKSRPAQASFRAELLELYAGKCVITGCNVPEAIEAAHVLPHNGDLIRDRHDNGLLLRRDLHALFDAMLWSINPDTSSLFLSERLKTSPYQNLHGRSIEHHVAPEPLRFHFTQFKKANKNG